MIRLVTFDLDDTLWNVRPALQRAEAAQNAWLNTHYPEALASETKETLLARKRSLLKSRPELTHNVSRFRQTFLEHLLLDAGLAPSDAAEAAENAFAAFIARRHDVDVFDQAEPVLRQLHPNYVLGSLTNGNADVRKTPLSDFFEFAFRAEDVGRAKPEPDLFEAALRHTGVAAHEMVHVGDHLEHDIEGAKNMGAYAVWLNPDATGSDCADAVIACLSELPAALSELD